MDRSEYMGMFLAESREHLDTLNLAVVRIEQAPDDRETLDEIFRAAHSLKGMSATMGFAGIAALTHKMEDVFELLRQRSGGLGPEAVEVVLECLDALGAAVQGVERDRVERIEPAPLIERLEKLVHRRDSHQPAPPAPTGPPAAALESLDAGARVVRVSAALDAGAAMPAVRAHQVLDALRGVGEVVGSSPSEDELDGFAAAVVEAWLRTDEPLEVLRAAVETVPEIAETTLFEMPAAGAPARAERHAPAARKRSAPVVRVDAERLTEVATRLAELRTHESRVGQLAAEAGLPELARAVEELVAAADRLESSVVELRVAPAESAFAPLPRLVRDLAKRLDKEVELRLVGQETLLDRTIVEGLGDPLVHLVRNALSHGCEAPDEREEAGKPRAAKLEVAARERDGAVLVEVRDDGRGIDPDHILALAAERGIEGTDALELLFSPGFSTAHEPTDISGRGVGLDAVRDRVRGLGGDIALLSAPGMGTVARLRLPAPDRLDVAA